MIKPVQTEARECTCEKCKYKWLTWAPIERPPAVCPHCKSREWNGGKKKGRPRTITITTPKPKRVRLEEP